MKRYNPDINKGLSDEEVQSRYRSGNVNYNTGVKTKTIGQIIFTNLFTLFNMLNLALGLCIFLVRSYKNLFFLGVVTCNTLISIIQEIRSKRAIDKLSIINSPVANVIRNGNEIKISVEEVVLDDIIKYQRGNQVVADSIVLDGTIEVNEALLTGEENSIVKHKGDILYSGSFIVSGKAIARVDKVGSDNYASKITDEAKYVKKVNSEIMKTFKKIIKVLSIVIVPLGLILFLKQYNLPGNNITDAVVNSVAAVVGMIPEGLILLTSTVLAVSVIRLTNKRVLVQQLYCIETLARVDTICLDKTGTLTEGTMILEDVVRLSNNYDIEQILSAYAREMSDDSPTMDAISRKYFTSETSWLWDIDFELLNSPNIKKVVLAGLYVSDIATRLEYTGIDFNKVYIHQMDSLVRDGTYINYKKIIVEMNSIIKRSKTAKDVFRELNKIKLEAKGKIIIKSLFNAIKAGAWAKAKELWGFIF